jgi:hypothetical protein
MVSVVLSDPNALPWLIAALLGAVLLYYYSIKTDISKIKGIPEIPGALPMYHPRQLLT